MFHNPIRTALLGAVIALGATPVLAQAATGGIVVVNVGRVFEESAAGKNALALMRPQADQLNTRLRALQAQFQKEEAALTAQQKTLAPATYQQQARGLAQREQTANAELQAKDRALQQTRQSVQEQILAGMNPVVTAIMKEKGAVAAIPTTATLQVSTSIDITPDVISRLDRALPRVNLTTAPAAPAR